MESTLHWQEATEQSREQFGVRRLAQGRRGRADRHRPALCNHSVEMDE